MSVWIFPMYSPMCAACGKPMMTITETFPDGKESTIRAWCVTEACQQMGKQFVTKAVEVGQI